MSKKINLQTTYRELAADLDTPVSVFLRLKDHGPSFLLESVTGGEQVARYSFIGFNPGTIYVLRGRTLEVHGDQKVSYREAENGQSPLNFIREILDEINSKEQIYGLPRFYGGLVGYLGYDIIRFIEPTVNQQPHATFPDAIFFHADTLVAFDHAFDRLVLIASSVDLETAEQKLDEIEKLLAAPLPQKPVTPQPSLENTELISNQTKSEFIEAVNQIKNHISAGDIFQGVYSQRFTRETTADPFDIYRSLRRLNPSPYMFYFDFGTIGTREPFRLIGASPEMHVRLENRIAALRPIAGTRPRGKTHQEDLDLEKELLDDPKERAEHLMLIDLARNDLGRVCNYGSVHVPEKYVVERYSHVMHIVSQTEGTLKGDADAVDLMTATFPAGTVSGAPKVRAMQIIENLEPAPRGPYAGAVGYFGYDGNTDTCIALRTLVMHGSTIHIQAGAGIVADSDPEMEFVETQNKARAVAEAVRNAETLGKPGVYRIYDPGD